MNKTLKVYLHRELVGKLIQDQSGQMLFQYDADWLNRSDAVPLSHSLPLREDIFKRNACRGFFAGILPEESKREMKVCSPALLGMDKLQDSWRVPPID